MATKPAQIQVHPETDREKIARTLYENESDHEFKWIDLFDGERAIYFRQADAVLALPLLPSGQEWKAATDIPDLKRGSQKEFIIAVRRAHNGRAYSFAASYLNAYPLEYRNECPKGDGCTGEGCDDGCPTTGWFIETGEDDDSTQFHSLNLKEGDEMLGWRNVPQWPLPAPPSIEKSGGEK